MEKEKEKWFYKYITNPFLTLLSYLLMVYTSLFLLISLFNVYSLPSQLLFPNGTYSEREQLVNMLNIIIVVIGLLLMYFHAKKKRNN